MINLSSTTLAICIALAGLVSAGDRFTQSPGGPALAISGDGAATTLSASDLQGLARTCVAVKEGTETVTYEDVVAGELLHRAGVPQGAQLRGEALARYVLASGSDGYRVVFSLAELDPGFGGSEVIVADSRDGRSLPASQGPLRLVASKDLRASRWVRMLKSSPRYEQFTTYRLHAGASVL